MNKYEAIKKDVFRLLETKSTGFYKRNAYYHLVQTATLCQLLAESRGLDCELAAIIGILHDISVPLDMNTFQHAARSAQIAKDILTNCHVTSAEENAIIQNAISRHSDKETIDDDYSELIKDADVWAHALDGQVLKPHEQQRLSKLKNA